MAKKVSTKKATAATAAAKATAAAVAAAQTVTETVQKTETAAPAASAKEAETAKAANTEVYIQFMGKEVYAKELVEKIKNVWTTEMEKDIADLQDLKVYIKPEENNAYYVINEDTNGCVSL